MQLTKIISKHHLQGKFLTKFPTFRAPFNFFNFHTGVLISP